MITKALENRIKRLLEAGGTQEGIAERLGTTRHHVRAVKKMMAGSQTGIIKLDNPVVPPKQSKLEGFRQTIVQWQQKNRLSLFLIHKKLIEAGVEVSISTLQRFCAERKKPEVYVPVITAPGEEAQVDYGYLGKFIIDGKIQKVWCFCMVLSYSRYAFYTVVTEQTVHSFIKCHQLAFDFFGGTPATVKIDNLGAGILEADFYQSEFQQLYKAFLEHHGTAVINARPCRGQDKGKVESGIKYIKGNFLPTVATRDYMALKAGLATWNETICNRRVHGTTRKVPEILFLKEERSQLFSLPREKFRYLQRDTRVVDNYGHIYYAYNFYSVPFHYCGETLQIEADNGLLKVYNEDLLVTTHAIDPRKGQFITFNGHKSYEKQAKTEGYYLEQMSSIGESATRLYEILRASKPYHWKNMVKGILSMLDVFSSPKVEIACGLALERGEADYKSVRSICIKEFAKKASEPQSGFPKYTNGYYHDLSLYDRLVNPA